uniref:Putative secreted protein n=1 Tax=Anopheles darlingi TaxID=43151 RepID=A0A2M4DBC7_ANODA
MRLWLLLLLLLLLVMLLMRMMWMLWTGWTEHIAVVMHGSIGPIIWAVRHGLVASDTAPGTGRSRRWYHQSASG